jgi:hypothetical protein
MIQRMEQRVGTIYKLWSEVESKGFFRWRVTLGVIGFVGFRPGIQRTQHFGMWICVLLFEKEKAPTLFYLSERTDLNKWTTPATLTTTIYPVIDVSSF